MENGDGTGRGEMMGKGDEDTYEGDMSADVGEEDALGDVPVADKKPAGQDGGRWATAAIVVACILVAAVIGVAIWRGSQTDPEAFEAYVEELFKEDIVQNTINLHYTLAYPENYGIEEYEPTLGSFSMEDFEKTVKEQEEIRKKLLSFDRGSLPKEQRITYDVLLDYVETELSVKDLTLYTEVLGPMTGYQAQLPVILAEYTFRTRRDIEDYLALVSQIDEIAKDIIAFEGEKSKAGLFMSDHMADSVIEQCAEFIENPEENYMIDVFNDKIETFEGLSQEEKAAYREQNRQIITTQVVDGYQILIDGLSGLKGSGENEMGLCHYDKGEEYYEYLVKASTGSDASIRDQMERIEDYIGDYFRLLMESVSRDPEIYDKLMDYQPSDKEPEDILQELTGKIQEDFPQIPDVDYRVKHVHPSMQEHLNPAFYLTTPVDDVKNNVIYINDKFVGKDTGGSMDLYATLAHEGFPGHLYQNAYTQSSGLPLVRNLLSYSGYSEGWATYVEFEYGYGFSGLEDPLADILAGESATSLALSSYVDIGVNYEGWTREDTARYLEGFGISGQETADEVYDAVLGDPAAYLSYFVGYLEFLNLRETAQEELGSAFDPKQFHAFLLEMGPAPFYIIEEYMGEWMDER